MKVTEFDFELPKHLIAQHPLPERDQSRLMVIHRKSGTWEHRTFRELPEVLTTRYFLVMNNTRVFPARLRAHRPGRRESIEVLLVREESPGVWSALLKPGRKAAVGQKLMLGPLEVGVDDVRQDGLRIIHTDRPEQLRQIIETTGEPPLPPYIERRATDDLTEDRLRYQTVYAKHSGSIAAPTAGLHFTGEILERLERANIERCEILLHVGYGTFQPVRVDDVEDHRLTPEYYEISEDTVSGIRERRAKGSLLAAVGTTTTRALEHWARQKEYPDSGRSGFCDLFIYPGYQFRVLNALLTNFHLPKSTLLMLVAAFVGREFILECYREAIKEGYRFFSYGDCMLIL